SLQQRFLPTAASCRAVQVCNEARPGQANYEDTRRMLVCLRRNLRTGSPTAAINKIPTTITTASARVCIAPVETSRVVASAAGCPARKSKVTRVVSAAAIVIAHTRPGDTTPVAITLGAAQAFIRYTARKPEPRPVRCPTIMLYVLALGSCGCSTNS